MCTDLKAEDHRYVCVDLKDIDISVKTIKQGIPQPEALHTMAIWTRWKEKRLEERQELIGKATLTTKQQLSGNVQIYKKNLVPLLRSTTLEISDCGKKTVVSFPAVVWAHQATRSLYH